MEAIDTELEAEIFRDIDWKRIKACGMVMVKAKKCLIHRSPPMKISSRRITGSDYLFSAVTARPRLSSTLF